MKMIIGYQIESKDGRHEIPDCFFSFQIMSNKAAEAFINYNPYHRKTWVKVAVEEDTIEEPSFLSDKEVLNFYK